MSDEVEFDTEAILQAAIEALPKKVELTYIDYRSELRTEQVQQILDGKVTDVESEIWDYSADDEHLSLLEVIKEAIPDEDERDALEADDTRYERLKDEIRDRDDSHPLRDLIRHTGSILMRYDLGRNTGDYDLPGESWSWDEQKVYTWARRLLRTLRLDPKAEVRHRNGQRWTNLDAALELVQNATYGGRLQVIWNGALDDVLAASIADTVGNKALRTITFRDPHVLVIDPMNGSGHDVQMAGSIIRTWNVDRVMTDDAAPGYGWDSICGLVRGAYSADVTIHPLPKDAL